MARGSQHPFEPFRIKKVEHIGLTTREERQNIIETAGFNVFNLPADKVMIDMLTDSGTGAMSDEQWASLMRGDESYAGSRSYHRLSESVNRIFGFKYFLPTHQGRAAEGILASCLLNEGNLIPSNTHFDTTAANILARGGTPTNLVIEASDDPNNLDPFKGNIDIRRLHPFLEEYNERIPFCMVTVTNNAGGGQPVSLANIESIHRLCREYGKPLFIDACRFAENAWFIKQRESGYEDWSIENIAHRMFSLADGATFSAKKDALVNIGGLLMMNDDELYVNAKNELIMREGFPSYGGLAGRDIDAMATGLIEGIDEGYLSYRTGQVKWLHDELQDRGIPVLSPPGGHAVYIDAGAILPHLDASEFPAQSLSVEMYLEGGVRTSEIGSVMLSFISPESGELVTPNLELIRLAIPRRTYTESHLRHVVDTTVAIINRADSIGGMEIIEAPELLRHFSARFGRIDRESITHTNIQSL